MRYVVNADEVEMVVKKSGGKDGFVEVQPERNGNESLREKNFMHCDKHDEQFDSRMNM